MGQVFSYLYQKSPKTPPINTDQENPQVDYYNADEELEDYISDMDTIFHRDRRLLDKLAKHGNDLKAVVNNRLKNDLPYFKEKIEQKNTFLKTVIARRDCFRPHLTDGYIKNIEKILDTHMAQFLIKDYLFVLKLLKFSNAHASQNDLENIIMHDFPLEDLQDELPLLSAQVTAWVQSNEEVELKNNLVDLTAFLKDELKCYLKKSEKVAQPKKVGVYN